VFAEIQSQHKTCLPTAECTDVLLWTGHTATNHLSRSQLRRGIVVKHVGDLYPSWILSTYRYMEVTSHSVRRGHNDERSGIMWLKDLLPQRIPNARILTFGYDTDALKFAEVSHLMLNDHATSLIVEWLRVRRDPEVSQHVYLLPSVLMYCCGQTTRRPIIYLAHSLGGIVVKHVSELHPSWILSTYRYMEAPSHSARRGHNEDRLMVSCFWYPPCWCRVSGTFE
jgi:hypothetical protein